MITFNYVRVEICWCVWTEGLDQERHGECIMFEMSQALKLSSLFELEVMGDGNVHI